MEGGLVDGRHLVGYEEYLLMKRNEIWNVVVWTPGDGQSLGPKELGCSSHNEGIGPFNRRHCGDVEFRDLDEAPGLASTMLWYTGSRSGFFRAFDLTIMDRARRPGYHRVAALGLDYP